jgi:ferredoxin-NADP reductase/ferredoxin
MFGFFKRDRSMTVAIENGPSFQANAGETVLNGALRHDIGFPFSCKVGGCGTCKCQLLSGKVKELTDKSYLLTKEEIQANFILGCQSIPRSDVQIRIPDFSATPSKHTGTVVRQETLTHDIVEVFVQLDQQLSYQAGQHTVLQPVEGDIPGRCYSFAHAAPEGGTNEVSFFVRRVPHGRLSNWLSSEQALGRPVSMTANQGDFYLREARHPMLCMAGGSGLAPIISLLEGCLTHSARERDVVLMMGARSQRDLYYLPQIKSLMARWKGDFRFTPILSDEPDNSDWMGARGLAPDHLSNTTVQGAQAYLCGPPPMVTAATNRLQALGMPPENIFADAFLDQKH